MMDELNVTRVARGEDSALTNENRRLQTLVSELLKANQELRFKTEKLEVQVDKLKRGMEESSVWAGMLI
jgi:uncharacterized protein YlxW (UPF0749 family)